MNKTDTPAKVASNDELGPLPESDGAAAVNKTPISRGVYEYNEVPAWSEPLVRSYAAAQVAAERERCARACHHPVGWLSAAQQQVADEILAVIQGPNALPITGYQQRMETEQNTPDAPAVGILVDWLG